MEPPAHSESSPTTVEPAPGADAPLPLGPDDPPAPVEVLALPPHEPAPAPPHPTHAAPWRLLLTISVLFVSIFLFLRVFLVEPFGVPTGSMAPALIGNHREAACPRCGHPIRVGAPLAGERSGHFENVPCPNCGKRADLSDVREINGDRLLVDKNVYSLRSPRRWEVAVFRCPYDLSKPYVKRVIGLPGEVLVVDDGDVYRVEGQGRELLRKGLPEVRETRIGVYDLRYAPASGWGPRWFVYPPDQNPRLPPPEKGRRLRQADGDVLSSTGLVLDASELPQAEVRLEYANVDLDGGREEPLRAVTSYDSAARRSPPLVHDFSLHCVVVASAAHKDASFALRLFDGADSVAAEVAVGPRATGVVNLFDERNGGLASARGAALEPGRTHTVELSFVDRRVILAIDGRVVVAPVDLPAVKNRAEVKRPFQIGALGCKVEVREVKLFRDIHYTSAGSHGTRAPARLGPDEYYMLGDNSGNSQDSREWPAPGVPEADFIGKPFLIHQPLRQGSVSIGGLERTFQTLDWGRLRWLH